jgi:mannose-6-phosphate isomerase-like protein (cupin superfamily)
MAEIVKKAWGIELVHCNEPEYCGKTLVIRDGGKSSLHFHRVKKETFYVKSGVVRLELDGQEEFLYPGDARTIAPGIPHRFSSVRGAEILEFSTHHDDADVVRLEPSA